MAIARFSFKDLLAGWRVAFGDRGGYIQAVVITDSAGTEQTIGSTTQYTEDVAAAADPVGGILIAVRRDTLTTAEVSADGDNIAIKATSKGQLHVLPDGGVASGAADSGNPLKVGGRFNSTLPTLADGQRGDAQLDQNGNLRAKITGVNTTGADALGNTVTYATGAADAGNVRLLGIATHGFNGTSWDRSRSSVNGLVVQPALPGSILNYAAAASGISNTTTAVTVFAAGGASVRNYVTAIQIASEALGAASELAIRDGAGGTVLWRTKIGTAGIVNGISIPFHTPIKGSANTLLEVVTLTASITGAVYFNAQGYTGV